MAALRAGWRLIQAAQLLTPFPGHEYDVSFLKHEFFFERIVDVRAGDGTRGPGRRGIPPRAGGGTKEGQGQDPALRLL